MDLGVLGQVVAAGKLLVTEGAAVRLHSGVGAPVAGKLVRSREPEEQKDGKVASVRTGELQFDSSIWLFSRGPCAKYIHYKSKLVQYGLDKHKKRYMKRDTG